MERLTSLVEHQFTSAWKGRSLSCLWMDGWILDALNSAVACVSGHPTLREKQLKSIFPPPNVTHAPGLHLTGTHLRSKQLSRNACRQHDSRYPSKT